MTWTLRDAQRDQAITDKIDAGDDRSAAILAGAFIQDRLVKALTARLKADKGVIKKVFKGYGPLSTFQSQIDIAYLMGIINEYDKNRLHTIREVRNVFAHQLELHEFDHPDLQKLCIPLWRIGGIAYLRQTFLESEIGENMKNITNLWLDPLVSLPDTPRNAYINSIKIILFFIESNTMFVEARAAGNQVTKIWWCFLSLRSHRPINPRHGLNLALKAGVVFGEGVKASLHHFGRDLYLVVLLRWGCRVRNAGHTYISYVGTSTGYFPTFATAFVPFLTLLTLLGTIIFQYLQARLTATSNEDKQ